MLGIVLGLLVAASYLGLANDAGDGTYSVLSLYGSAVLVFALGYVVGGLLLTRTVGMMSFPATLAALAGAALALFGGGAAYAPGFLLHAVAWIILGNGMRYLLTRRSSDWGA